MNTETLQQLSEQADALAKGIEALTDPVQAAAAVQQAVEDVQTSAALEQGVAKEMLRRATNKANKTLKSGMYVYTNREYGNVRITSSGAVYTASKGGWRRVKGKAAQDLLDMIAREQAKAAAATPVPPAAVEGQQ